MTYMLCVQQLIWIQLNTSKPPGGSPFTLQWASAKEAKCFASSSLNSGSMSSHRTANPLQPNCSSCLSKIRQIKTCFITWSMTNDHLVMHYMQVPCLSFQEILLLLFTISHVLPRWYPIVEGHPLSGHQLRIWVDFQISNAPLYSLSISPVSLSPVSLSSLSHLFLSHLFTFHLFLFPHCLSISSLSPVSQQHPQAPSTARTPPECRALAIVHGVCCRPVESFPF